MQRSHVSRAGCCVSDWTLVYLRSCKKEAQKSQKYQNPKFKADMHNAHRFLTMFEFAFGELRSGSVNDQMVGQLMTWEKRMK
jgi:hypothetical protein